VVLTDLLMPKCDGFETIRDFRKQFPQVKIIAMSGGGQMEPVLYLEMAEQIGASFTLMKPFSIEELAAALNKALAE
jgi:CheY-like chemotaxis protein